MMHGVVYKIIYPNGKIYVGKDETNNINYFGSADAAVVAADFTSEQRRSFAIRREILWESGATTRTEINAIELRHIIELQANNPTIGYNRWPKFSQVMSMERLGAK